MLGCMKTIILNNCRTRRTVFRSSMVCSVLIVVSYYYLFYSWIWKNRILPQSFCTNDKINFTSVKNIPEAFRTTNDFQMISPHPNKMYFYSAYFDEEMSSVKIIGGVMDRTDTKVYCHLYNRHNVLYLIEIGTIYHFEHNWSKLPYIASFVNCPAIPPECEPPAYVSLSAEGPLELVTPSSNLFRVEYSPFRLNDDFRREEYDFAVCVAPSFSYEKPRQFLEWYEFYKLMGVQKFTFYNESIGPITSCLMKQLEIEEGQIEILNWSPGFESGVEMFYHSQMIQTMDCVLRSRGHVEYIIDVDMDEFIMPVTDLNFKDLLQNLVANFELVLNVTSAIVFRNSMFYINIPGEEDIKNSSVLEELSIAKYKWRSKDMNPLHERSKYFGIPDRISEPGVHYVYRSVESSKMFEVPVEVAYLHHYRLPFNSTGCTEVGTCDTVMEDQSSRRFIDKLGSRVELQVLKYGAICKLTL